MSFAVLSKSTLRFKALGLSLVAFGAGMAVRLSEASPSIKNGSTPTIGYLGPKNRIFSPVHLGSFFVTGSEPCVFLHDGIPNVANSVYCIFHWIETGATSENDWMKVACRIVIPRQDTGLYSHVRILLLYQFFFSSFLCGQKKNSYLLMSLHKMHLDSFFQLQIPNCSSPVIQTVDN